MILLLAFFFSDLAIFFPDNKEAAIAEIGIPKYIITKSIEVFNKNELELPAEAEIGYNIFIPTYNKRVVVSLALNDNPYSKRLKAELFSDWVLLLNKDALKKASPEQIKFAVNYSKNLNRRVYDLHRYVNFKLVDIDKTSDLPEDYPAVRIGKSDWQVLPKLNNYIMYLELMEYIKNHYYYEESLKSWQEQRDNIQSGYWQEENNRKDRYATVFADELRKTDIYKALGTIYIYNSGFYNPTTSQWLSLDELGYIDNKLNLLCSEPIFPKSPTGFIIKYQGSREYDLPIGEDFTPLKKE